MKIAISLEKALMVMSHIRSNRRRQALSFLPALQFISKALLSSYGSKLDNRNHRNECKNRQFLITLSLLGLLLTIVNPSQAQISAPPTLTQVPDNSESQTVANQLPGRWQAQDPTSKQEVTLIFAPNNQLFFILPANDGSAVAIQVNYQIDTTTQPMQLDMAVTPDQKALTIFELTPEGKLRLELNGINPGEPRPNQFSTNSPLFEKVSDATTVPENIEVIELESKPAAARVTIPIQYIAIVNRTQQAYYLENGKFAENVEELKIVTNLETESYRYQIIPVGDRTQKVAITAQPKDAGLPSYIGVVFSTQVDGYATTIAQICESDQPATQAPAIPTLIPGKVPQIQCPPGSHSFD